MAFSSTNAYAPPQSSLFDDMDMMGEVAEAYAGSKKKGRMAFEEIEATGEYMETHYYKLTQLNQSTSLVKVNAFWHDYA
jgi:hypothetical protein